MTLQEIVKLSGMDVDAYTEMGINECILYTCEDGKQTFDLNLASLCKVSDRCAPHLMALAKQPWIMKLEVYLHLNIFGKGPKVFRPTSFQLEHLENMTLSLEVQDFHAPFETCVIELPEDYCKARQITGFLPALSIFHHDKKTGLMAHSVMDGKYALKGFWNPKPEDMMEEWWAGEYEDTTRNTQLPFTIEEQQTELKIRRAVANYMLLLDEVGVKSCGPTNGDYAQLVKWCRKNTKHTKLNKLRLQASPFLYKIKQEVELVRVVADESELPDRHKTDRTMRPHSRRGFYRMQPHGPKNSLRKRIRIPATIVNKHMLVNGVPSSASYKT